MYRKKYIHIIKSTNIRIIFTKLRNNLLNLNTSLTQRVWLGNRRLNVDPACSCGQGLEDIEHFLWKCPIYDSMRNHLFTSLDTNNNDFKFYSDQKKTYKLLNLDIKCCDKDQENIISIICSYLSKITKERFGNV